MSRRRSITVRVNGTEYSREVESRKLLVDFIREDLGLTGTHIGCEHGHCGCCTVMLNGIAVKSCLVLAVQADGAEVITIEGLAQNGQLHPVQEAFAENHGLQCGFCTPGMLISALSILEENGDPSDEEIRLGLTGNICRCTGYVNIVKSIKAAANKMRSQQTVTA